MNGIWAVVPVKRFAHAKIRLAAAFSPSFREALAATMLRDVLAALAGARGLAGIVVVTEDPTADLIARGVGARILTDGATSGHTGAVNAAIRMLLAEGAGGMLQVPGDIPGITPAEIETLLEAHGDAPAFTIAPAHDGRGSNAVLLSPPDAVPLAFGDDSCLPHIAAARARGIEPAIVRLKGIGMDVDHPADLVALAGHDWSTRTHAFLARPANADKLRVLAAP